MKLKEVRTFFSKNAVLVVMVPLLFGAHYGWYKLQYVQELVPLDDRKKLPKILRVQE